MCARTPESEILQQGAVAMSIIGAGTVRAREEVGTDPPHARARPPGHIPERVLGIYQCKPIFVVVMVCSGPHGWGGGEGVKNKKTLLSLRPEKK